MSALLQVQQLGKSYRGWGSEKRRIASWFIPSIKPRQEHWVLKDVSFSVSPGESVGIIGQNGAGKSTLLKLITGTTRPTQGNVYLNGRVSAILELGMGFNLDLTGRQNAYHSAGLMGYSQRDIANAMPAMEAFAEIGEYFDKPMRTYSSGMQMRVAFSVATAFRPDLLIIDEALSVGDVYFQQKCFRRIREFSANGTTLLFVTHDIVAVQEICSRAIYLRQGRMVVDGMPQSAIALYQEDILKRSHPAADSHAVNLSQNYPSDQQQEDNPSGVAVSGAGHLITKDVTCLSIGLLDESGNEVTAVPCGHSATLVIRYKVHRDLGDPHIGFKIHNRLDSVIFETNTYCMSRMIGAVEKEAVIETRYQFPVDFAPGEYTITVGLANQGFDKCEFKEFCSYLHSIFVFTVLPNEQLIIWSGMINIRPHVDWDIYPDMMQNDSLAFDSERQ